jgi:hypothetical protein
MLDVHGIQVTGGSFPAQIWAAFMQGALAGAPVVGWREPTTPVEWQPWQGERASGSGGGEEAADLEPEA